VSAPAQEDFLTLYCDPGEDFGWCVGRTLDLLAAGTEKMWPFADAIWDKIRNPLGAVLKDPVYVDTNPLSSDTHTRDGVDVETMRLPIGRIVCEDFRIYPPGVGSGPPEPFDKVRTARVIGAITFMCRLHHIPLVFQGANIKPAAVAAGAEELYYRPLHENRHQNDAIQHFVFFTNTELLQLPLPVPDSVREEDHT
jgi:hypothetical protein